MGVLAITGTDTEVGKTIVTSAIAALAKAHGLRVAVVKPTQTGVAEGEPGDIEVVRALSGVEDVRELARHAEPLAPATAARRAGEAGPSVARMAKAVLELADRDLVLVEGAGGLLVRIDARGATLADLARQTGARALVVARAGLGTLNATALTCEALRAREIDCAGVVIGAWPIHPDLAALCNLQDLSAYAEAPLLGRVPEGAGSLEPAGFLKLAQGELEPGLLRAGLLAKGRSAAAPMWRA